MFAGAEVSPVRRHKLPACGRETANLTKTGQDCRLAACSHDFATETKHVSPLALVTLPQLEVLSISQARVTSQGLQKLCTTPDSRLRMLDVHLTLAGHNGFGKLDGLRSLEELDASQSQVTDQSLRGWVSPPMLKKLNLAGNPFSNASLPAMLNSPALEELDLQKVAGVNDPGLNHIVKKKSLRFIQLDQTGARWTQDDEFFTVTSSSWPRHEARPPREVRPTNRFLTRIFGERSFRNWRIRSRFCWTRPTH